MKNLNLIAILSLVLFLTACEKTFNIGCISPEGDVETRTVSFDKFEDIDLRVDAKIFITEGETQEVSIEASANIIDRIIDDSRVRNEELTLEINGCTRLNNEVITINITVPTLSRLKVSGDGEINMVGTFFNLTDLTLTISGDGHMNLATRDLDFFSAIISGDGSLVCTGSAQTVDIKISGDGKAKLFGFPSKDVKVEISGDGNCEINATEILNLKIGGDGSIESIGSVEKQDIEINGAGTVNNFGLSSLITDIDISGSGECEVSVGEELNVKISGDGFVCYKGNPIININGNSGGEIKNCD